MLIEEVIEKKRIEMLQVSQKYGLTHFNTIKCSQELDGYLNYFNNKISPKLVNFSDVKVHKSAFINILDGSQLFTDDLKSVSLNWLDSNFISFLMDELKNKMGNDILAEIGQLVPVNSMFPSGIDSFEKGLIFLNDAYKLNHLGKYFGEYIVFQENHSTFKLFCNTPMYSNEFNYGVLNGLAKKFGREIKLEHFRSQIGGEFNIKIID